MSLTPGASPARDQPITASSPVCRELTLESLAEAAALLVQHASRAEAARFVDRSFLKLGDRRGLLLLAQIYLDGGTPANAEAALVPLYFWRLTEPWDVEGVALLRRALGTLGQTEELETLDRDLTWAMGAPRSDLEG
jgi:hypothetical protein